MPIFSYGDSADFDVSTWPICISAFTECQHRIRGAAITVNIETPAVNGCGSLDIHKKRKKTHIKAIVREITASIL
jgi:hypothetical protein